MRYDLPERVIRELFSFATKHSVRKIILFGSRARGNNTERSDVDIAVYGGDFDSFYWDIKENIHSLLMFDVINADASISEELKKEIQNHVKRVTAPYKYPRLIEFVDEIPETISGKIRRVEIRNNDNKKE